MAINTLEERVALLEQQVLQLKRQMQPSATAWWDQISGAFAEVPAFDEAVELGRRYREAQRPVDDEDVDVSA